MSDSHLPLPSDPPTPETIHRTNKKLMLRLALLALAMFGFGYLLIPIYYKVCEVLGINVIASQEQIDQPTTNLAQAGVDTSRTIVVEFDANVRESVFQFKPLKNSMEAHPGAINTIIYEVKNPYDRKIIAQAIPSYTPSEFASSFEKIECFCFSQQTFEAGEIKQLPVVFLIKKDAPKNFTQITLSYTFFEIKPAQNPVSS